MATDEPHTPVKVNNPPMRFSDSPNARSKTITVADGTDTHGTLNQHLSNNPAYQVGVHDDKGQRRTMEDAYSFIVDFASIRGQGYFAVFDGHAGKYAAEWCGQHFHEHLLECLHKNPSMPIPDVLNHTFHSVDSALSQMAQNDSKMHSGCTAVTAFLRLEDENGEQSFLPPSYDFGRTDASSTSSDVHLPDRSGVSDSPTQDDEDSRPSSPSPSPGSSRSGKQSKTRGSRFISALKSLSGSSQNENEADGSPPVPEPISSGQHADAFVPPQTPSLRRILYTANAGDARAVLCREGKAIRLTYDHKGSDKQEAKRIMDAGGFVMSGRVNGVLAVTRSLGDSSMKDYVVGSPYTTETELGSGDEFLIIACDGLWDVTSDQQAVDLIREIQDAQKASHMLVQHALKESSTDNITAIVVRFPTGEHQTLPSAISDNNSSFSTDTLLDN
ncbi:protein phosphatase 2C [Schizopora paradoxa]|uniref:Protein phosphatase 2C n=1 Tax=Schizopora paradoxa TaxID=27342 RepID=A0A0H2SQY9_9AGAM|nr:protein phosphatase 2C [Schizopora paradoxa]